MAGTYCSKSTGDSTAPRRRSPVDAAAEAQVLVVLGIGVEAVGVEAVGIGFVAAAQPEP